MVWACMVVSGLPFFGGALQLQGARIIHALPALQGYGYTRMMQPLQNVAAPRTPTAEPVGLIGLGLMGGALAHRLTGAGFGVLGFDSNPDMAAVLPGIEIARSADEICLRCSRIVIAVYNTDQVEGVILDLETTAHP